MAAGVHDAGEHVSVGGGCGLHDMQHVLGSRVGAVIGAHTGRFAITVELHLTLIESSPLPVARPLAGRHVGRPVPFCTAGGRPAAQYGTVVGENSCSAVNVVTGDGMGRVLVYEASDGLH